jgi:hypothetical protein
VNSFSQFHLAILASSLALVRKLIICTKLASWRVLLIVLISFSDAFHRGYRSSVIAMRNKNPS